METVIKKLNKNNIEVAAEVVRDSAVAAATILLPFALIAMV